MFDPEFREETQHILRSVQAMKRRPTIISHTGVMRGLRTADEGHEIDDGYDDPTSFYDDDRGPPPLDWRDPGP